jgi:hypothetical protein
MQRPHAIDALRRAGIAILANCWGVLLIALAWEAWVRWKDFNAIVIPHPLAVVRDIMDAPALYASNAGQTVALAVGGLAIGLLIGSLLRDPDLALQDVGRSADATRAHLVPAAVPNWMLALRLAHRPRRESS